MNTEVLEKKHLKINNGQIFYINFSGNIGREINNRHLGIIYSLPTIKDVVFCIPLTSPKIKHFKTKEDFINRNYKEGVHFSWQYLKQTDSIALLDQMKTISTRRLISPFLNQDHKIVILDNNTQKLLKNKIYKYMEMILDKDILNEI